MKKQLILFLLLGIIAHANSQSGDELEREKIYTSHTVTLPRIEINDPQIYEALDSIVLSKKLHERKAYEDFIYAIRIIKDSIDANYIMHVAMTLKSSLGEREVKGFFLRDHTIFLYYGDNPDSLYTQKECELIRYQRADYILCGKIYEDYYKGVFYDPPEWSFINRKETGKLEFFKAHFLPLDARD